jgi:hypothetical protein
VDWHSLHVTYYDEDQDGLLLHGVRPLLRHVRDHVDGASFSRHWRQGPHLRINLRTDARTFHEVVHPAAQKIIGGYLERCPSTRRLDPERELPAHRRLAELELDRGPLLPWHADNTLRIAPWERRDHAVGGPEAADLLADFGADTTELVFRILEAVSGAGRLATGFNLLIATAHAFSAGGVRQGFVAFRSHAEAFLAWYPEGAGLRPRWQAHVDRNVPALVERVGAVVATLDQTRRAVPFVEDWVTALRPYRQRAGLLPPTVGMDGTGDGTPAWSVADLAERSPFHARLFGNSKWKRTMESASFGQYRMMLNLTYLSLTRLGVKPIERFLLCHLAAEAVERACGVSALDLVTE